MNRASIVVVALALAGTLAFPSVAVPLTNSDRITEDVHLAPTDGPNGDYAYLADGELVVDLSATNPNVDGAGVNPDAVTTVDDVFRIRYDGTQYANVWLTHESDAVTFRARGRPIESERNAVTLVPNESVAVGLAVDTTGLRPDGLVDDITVHARVAEPADGSTSATAGVDADDGDDGPSIRKFAPSADSRRVTLSNAPAGRSVSLGIDRLELDGSRGGDLTLDGLGVTTADGSVGVTVRVVGPNATARQGVPGGDLLGAVSVDVDGGARGWRARFGVAWSYLDAVGVRPANLTVYRNAGDGWRRLNASAVDGRGDRLTLTANASGDATLVVAAAERDTADVREQRVESAGGTNDRATGGERRPHGAALRPDPSTLGDERRGRVEAAELPIPNSPTPVAPGIVAVAALLAGLRRRTR